MPVLPNGRSSNCKYYCIVDRYLPRQVASPVPTSKSVTTEAYPSYQPLKGVDAIIIYLPTSLPGRYHPGADRDLPMGCPETWADKRPSGWRNTASDAAGKLLGTYILELGTGRVFCLSCIRPRRPGEVVVDMWNGMGFAQCNFAHCTEVPTLTRMLRRTCKYLPVHWQLCTDYSLLARPGWI